LAGTVRPCDGCQGEFRSKVAVASGLHTERRRQLIEKIHQGVYGYRTEATIPKIAGGNGIPISGSLKIGRNWTYKGHHYSYVNAL
jgi:hypothetical protein